MVCVGGVASSPLVRRLVVLVVVGLDLLLVLLDLPVELVDQGVDGRVHVVLDRVGKQGVAADVDRGLRLVPQLLDRQDAVHVGDVVEMPFQARQLAVDVVAQGGVIST